MLRGPVRVIAALFLSSLVACVTPIEYLPIDHGEGRYYGYKDTVISSGHHKLLVIHTGHDPTSEQVGAVVAEKMWHRRATELCGAAGYAHNFFRYEQQTVLYDIYGGRAGAFEIEGTVTCEVTDPVIEPVPSSE